MVKDAEANAEADKKRREAVEARNGLEALIHSTDKTLKDNGDKVPAAEKAEVEAAIAEARARWRRRARRHQARPPRRCPRPR